MEDPDVGYQCQCLDVVGEPNDCTTSVAPLDLVIRFFSRPEVSSGPFTAAAWDVLHVAMSNKFISGGWITRRDQVG